MTHRPKAPPAPPIAGEVAEITRPVAVLAWALAVAIAQGIAALAAVAMVAALAWHLTAWAWRESAQVAVLLAVVAVGWWLFRLDRHAREENGWEERR